MLQVTVTPTMLIISYKMTLIGASKNQLHAPSVPRSDCFPDTHTSNLPSSVLSTHHSLTLFPPHLCDQGLTPTLSVLFPSLTLREALPLVAVRTEENKASWVSLQDPSVQMRPLTQHPKAF